MDEYITIKEGGDFEKARSYFDNNNCSIKFSREINNKDFLEKFLLHFGDIDKLSFLAYGDGVSYNFLYEMKNLKNLYLHTLYPIDFKKLNQLKTLSLWWNKKMISNFDKLDKLEHLNIIEFDEKDLTKLSSLTNLKSLSFATAKIKSLKGIETLTNLENLSLGAVRSLTDLSDITTLQKLEELEINICWKLEDFSPIGSLQKLKRLRLIDCKKLASIQFVKDIPNLKYLSTMGSTVINDYDTTPAEHVPVFFGSIDKRYNKQYPEKEIHKKLEDL